MQRLQAAVGAFEETGQSQDTGWRRPGFVVEFRGHAGAFGYDQRHGGDGSVGEGGAEIGGCGGEFFGLEGDVGRWALFGPGDREGVRHPEGEGGQVDVGVGAGDEGPGARDGECDSAGLSGERFHGDLCDTVAGDVAVEETHPAQASLCYPQRDDPLDVGALG